jgi:hypothetical protein
MSKTKKAAPKQKPEQLIYCGPNFPGGAIQSFTAFKGGLPGYVNDLAQKCPAIKKLCVPITNFNKTRQAINISGTPENRFYKQILDFVNKGGV